MTDHLLLVQFPDLLRQSLAEQLKTRGYEIREEVSIGRVAADWTDKPADLVIVDGEPEDISVRDLCGFLGHLDVPMILLTGRPVSSLAAARTPICVGKPFRFADLLRRIEGLLTLGRDRGPLRIGDYHLDRPVRELTDGAGRRVHLTEKEIAILLYLHDAGARAVSRDELLDVVWGYASAISTHTVESHIYRLRRKLARALDGDGLLRTENGGYRLSAG